MKIYWILFFRLVIIVLLVSYDECLLSTLKILYSPLVLFCLGLSLVLFWEMVLVWRPLYMFLCVCVRLAIELYKPLTVTQSLKVNRVGHQTTWDHPVKSPRSTHSALWCLPSAPWTLQDDPTQAFKPVNPDRLTSYATWMGVWVMVPT